MNDKIKQLLENAEQSDAIAKNKWRIENREQLREERKEKLKELMENNKQQTAVEWLEQEMLKPNLSMKGILEQAKEMEKERIAKAFDDGDYNYHYSRKTGDDFEDGKEYFNEVYG
jgi:hypothetical protein